MKIRNQFVIKNFINGNGNIFNKFRWKFEIFRMTIKSATEEILCNSESHNENGVD